MILKSSFIELGKKRWWDGAVSKASDVVTGVGAQPQLTDLVLVLAHWPCLPARPVSALYLQRQPRLLLLLLLLPQLLLLQSGP